MRVVTTDGRLRTALAAFQLERTDDYVALAVPVGSPGFSRHGVGGGPRGSFLLPPTTGLPQLPPGWDTLIPAAVNGEHRPFARGESCAHRPANSTAYAPIHRLG